MQKICAIYLLIEQIKEVDFFFPLSHLKMWHMASYQNLHTKLGLYAKILCKYFMIDQSLDWLIGIMIGGLFLHSGSPKIVTHCEVIRMSIGYWVFWPKFVQSICSKTEVWHLEVCFCCVGSPGVFITPGTYHVYNYYWKFARSGDPLH